MVAAIQLDGLIMKFRCLLLAALVAPTALADAQLPVRDRVAQFLGDNVVGRIQKIDSQGTIVDGANTYQVDFKATIQWSGLKTTAEGLVLDERREVVQTNTKIDAQGAAVGEPMRHERVVVQRHAVSERRTTQSLVGMTTMLENSEEDPTGSGFVTMIELSADGKELYLYQSLAGFVERSLDGITEQPVAMAMAATMRVDGDGKLVTDQTWKFYKVDINHDFARQEINRFNLTATEVKP